MRVKFGNTTKDVDILDVTPENYIVPKGEEGSYHCRIEQTNFNPRTGKRNSVPRIQKFEAKMWPMLKRNLKLQGWDIDVLYDPTDYLKKKEEEAQLTMEQRIKKQQEAEEAKKKAERDALKKELLEELKKEGLVPAKTNKETKSETKEPKTGGSKK